MQNQPIRAPKSKGSIRPLLRHFGKKERNFLYMALMIIALCVILLCVPQTPTVAVSNRIPPATSQKEAVYSDIEIPLRFTEVMTSNTSAYPDESGNFPDWIELTNEGENPISLHGLGLSDRPTRVSFLFPDMVLQPGEQVVVFASGKALDQPNALHAPFKLSSLGETIYLFDTQAHIIEELPLPLLETDISYARMSDAWTQTTQYTPAYPNTDAGYAAYRAASVVAGSPLMLNEIIANNRTTLMDEDGTYSDWIELYNAGDAPITLSGYALSDDESQRLKWKFPRNAVIPSHGYYLVFASGKNRAPSQGTPHANFNINTDGETIILCDPLGRLIDRVKIEELDADTSWGRYEGGGDWTHLLQPTPGLPNSLAGITEMDRRMRMQNTQGLLISEVMPSNSGIQTPFGNTSYDWIEIVNTSSQPILLRDYGLSDNVKRPRKWQFPDVTLAPGGYLLVFASGLEQPPEGSNALHASFRLSAIGSTITLCDPHGSILDKIVIPRLSTDFSYGRNLQEDGLFYYDQPTPGTANHGGVTGYAEMPTILLPGGRYDGTQYVEVTAPPAIEEIRYTINGSDPTRSDMLYTEPIMIPQTAVLRVRGFTGNLQPSAIATTTYLIGAYHSLPVISLVTDPTHLWDPVNGMYAGNYTQSARTAPAYNDLPYWKKLPYDGNFEFFEADGHSVINQGVEISLHGQYSLDIPQKSFRVSAKAKYGAPSLDYAFFPDRPYDTYQSLVIRNGGNDGKYTRIVDGFQSRIVDWVPDTTVYHMPWRPVVVYLNGEYWGHYNIRERVNKYSLARYEGWDNPDNLDLLKSNGTSSSQIRAGDNVNYKQLLEYIKTHDLNNQEYLQVVTDWIDIDNYFDWIIFEMYFGNTDTGNMKFYRQRAPGAKWKWVLFDLDWGMFNSKNDGCKIWLNPKGAGDQRINNSIIVALLKVPEMRDKLLRRYGQLFQEVFVPDRMIALADEMATEIEPEMSMHFMRWSRENSLALDIEAPTNPESAYTYWKNRLERLQNVIVKRNNLVWDHVKTWFGLTDTQMIEFFGKQPAMPENAK